MKSKLKAIQIKRFELIALPLFAFAAFFLIGCNETHQSKSQSSRPTDRLTREAEHIIGQALADRDPRIRAGGIELVADTKQNKFMPKVQKLLKDEFVPVKFSAVLAIADTGYRPAKRDVRRLLTDEPNVKIAAAYALSRLGTPDALKIVRDAVKSKDQTVRANAVFLLGKSGHESDLPLLIWAQLDELSDDRVKLQALEARARLKDSQVFKRLWAILYSSYADDRIMAVRAMGMFGDKKAKDILMTKLDDKVLEVRLVAAEQLGALGDTTGAPEVLDVFTKNLRAQLDKKIDRERVNILTALAIGEINTPNLTKFLPKLLKNESKLVRIAAARAVLRTAKARNTAR